MDGEGGVIHEVRTGRQLEDAPRLPNAAAERTFVDLLGHDHHPPVARLLAARLLAVVALAEAKEIQDAVGASQRDGAFESLGVALELELRVARLDDAVRRVGHVHLHDLGVEDRAAVGGGVLD